MPDSTSLHAIIMSSAYLSSGLVAEFGLMPPAFLPLANRRLYEWQVKTLAAQTKHITITLPEDFVPEQFDRSWFGVNGVTVHSCPANLSLGRALRDALESLPNAAQETLILFGDTLISNMESLPLDGVAIGYVIEYSQWGYCIQAPDGKIKFTHDIDSAGGERKPVIAGGFRLDCATIKKCLIESADNFFAALNLYSARRRMILCDVQSGWYDFGHTNAYFLSRQSFTTERTFNSIEIHNRIVRKAGTQPTKIAAEAKWFEKIPNELRVYLPNYLGQQNNTYSIEYLYSSLISDLFVYGRLPEFIWKQILQACQEFLVSAAKCVASPEDIKADIEWLYVTKTQERLAQYAASNGRSLDYTWIYNGTAMPSLNAIMADMIKNISLDVGKHTAVMHGDFHFANMFFDFRSLGIKLVDPRGMIRDAATIYGDRRYDVAKLAHSVDGLYDFIIAGLLKAEVRDYDITFKVTQTRQMIAAQNLFATMDFGVLSPRSREIKAIVILLFLSMLPLHADDKARQDTLLANVFRLYQEFKA